jgi:uncharacterized protein with NAD-binding domain and iron-sulfur cluster
MGEVVFAPLYQVLRARGVRFSFLSHVDNLGVSADGQEIASVALSTHGLSASYEPLEVFGGLPCWPGEPRSAPTGERRAISLRRGEDFDLVVLGIPVGVHHRICKELISRSGAWRRMTENVRTVASQAFQLWFDRRLDQLGCEVPSPLVSTYVDSVDTYADMSHLLPREGWKSPPGHLAYICGVLEDGQAEEQVHRNAYEFLTEHAAGLWPTFAPGGAPEWQWLTDPAGRSGPERLRAQYLRANVAPTERFTMSGAGTIQHRLHPAEAGFSNLYLAGDWTRNGFNLGCIEASVMSGRQAARAICGAPVLIDGETDDWLL